MYDAVQADGNVLPYAGMESVNMEERGEYVMRVEIPRNPERTNPAGAGVGNINSPNRLRRESSVPD